MKTSQNPCGRWVVVFGLLCMGCMIVPNETSAQRLFQRLRQRIPAPPQPAARPKTPATNTSRISPIKTGSSAAKPLAPAAKPKDWQDYLAPKPGRDLYGYSVLVMPKSQSDQAAEKTLKPRVARPISQGVKEAATFGIDAFERTDVLNGIQVADFHQHSLADEAGVQVGDVIVAMNGLPTRKIADLVTRIDRFEVGTKVDLQIMRNGRLTEIQVPLVASMSADSRVEVMKPAVGDEVNEEAKRDENDDADDGPDGLQQSRLQPPTENRELRPVTTPLLQDTRSGLTLSTDSLVQLGAKFADMPNRRGVVVESVAKDSAATQAGLKVGDRVVAINGLLVKDLASWALLMSRSDIESKPTLKIVRGSSLLQRQLGVESKETAVGINGEAKPAGGLLGGVGSFFGNLMKPNEESPTNPDAGKAEADRTNTKPTTELLPRPKTLPKDNETQTLPSPQDSSKISRPVFLPGPDDLKAIDQTAHFDIPAAKTTVNKPAIAPVPPSLRTVEPPQQKNADETARLKAEIQRLQEKLEKLKG